MKPRCSNCSQTHSTADCLLEGAIEYKCANCNGNHRGTDRKCPKREQYKEIRKKASTTNQHGRKSDTVPPPAVNLQNFPALPSRAPKRSTTPPPPNPVWIKPTDYATPGNLLSQHQTVENYNEPLPDKFGMDEMMKIFDEMVSELQKCQNRREQIRALGHFIIRYGC